MFVHSAENQSWLRARWQGLVTPLSPDRSAADVTWDTLVRHYSEPQRAYHNLSHVMALLRHADAERANIHRPDIVEFAIWFHDAIYDTRAHDNEQRSAAWARHAMLGMGIDPHITDAVAQCILATRRHEVSSHEVVDLPLFLDLDLAILGAHEETYRQYSNAIRAEYGWVPGPAYREGRARILKNFLERPVLFFTPALAARYEMQARRNIEWELQELSSS
jgi:predicted metal-dependent HD superfamily phosphohydrolase